jgi:glycosyltransferase involved in cell wall biosynthesis
VLGGYEVAAHEVHEGLAARGHDILVLTTDWGNARAPTREPHVRRALHGRYAVPHPSLARLAVWEMQDLWRARRALRAARPDVVLLWNAGSLSHRALVELMNGRVPSVVYVFGDWPLRKHRAPESLDLWTSRFAARREPAARRALRRLAAVGAGAAGLRTRATPLRFDHFAFGSAYLAATFDAAGLHARHTERCLYYGLFGAFADAAQQPLGRPPAPGPLRVLFAGRLWEAKGVHTVVEAVALGLRTGLDLQLTVAGPPEDDAYARRLRAMAGTLEPGRVRFAGQVAREAMPALYRDHHVLVMASTYDEPFGIVQIEAMALGCVVVSTGRGGAAEVVRDGETGLRFRAGDAHDLARQLTRLATDAVLAETLRTAGHAMVRTRFLGSRMLDEMETCLAGACRPAAL